MGLPSGMVTFLFTDIEGSSALWETAGASMEGAIVHHDRLVGDVIGACNGHVVKKTGDGFMAVFADPANAVAAATAMQSALESTAWDGEVERLRVRIGIHTGPGEPLDGDYLGPAPNRAARIEAAGHGGQVLVSAATRELCGDRADPAEFRDLGEHHLTGLSRVERIYQVEEPGHSEEFPPLRTEATPTNLPAALKPLLGREAELAELRSGLDEARLLTVTGAGGAGKTTLAVEAARRRMEAHPGGVWFFELASLTDGARVATEMLGTMRRPAPAGRDPEDVVVGTLATQQALLLIDNCEHLVEDVGRLVAKILRAAPRVKVLATSREPLGVGGERVWRIPTMGVPEETSAAAVRASDAGALFVTRAGAADASFALTDDNAATVATICRRLDGLPLAIELAAARLRSMSLGDIDGRLEDRFSLLRGGDRDEVPHHQTLRGTVAWSYDLLAPEEQRLYRCLSVFAGGFDLDAAESVEGDDPEVLDRLDHLVAQSLVIADGNGSTRYRMLETIREFAAQALADEGEHEAAARAHLDWVLALVKQGARQLEGRNQVTWLRRFRTEIDNIRVALAWAIGQDPVTGAAIVAALTRFFWMYAAEGDTTAMRDSTSFLQEGYDWATAMLEAGGDVLPETLRARLQMGTGGLLCVRLGRYEEALGLLRAAAEVFERADDRRNLGWASFYQGVAGFGMVPTDVSLSAFRRAMDLHTEAEDPIGSALAELLYGLVMGKEDLGQARPHLERFADVAAAVGAPTLTAHAADALALADALRGPVDESARAGAAESLLTFRTIDNYACLCHALGGAAAVLARTGDYEGAARALGIADATRDRLSMVLAPYEEVEPYVRRVAGAAAQDPSWDSAIAEGRTFDPDEGIDWVVRRLGFDPSELIG